MKTLPRITARTARNIQTYKAVLVYYPQSNLKHAALLDVECGALLSFDGVEPFHPMGNTNAIQQLIAGGGLVVGSVNHWIPCRHCHNSVYMLDHITDVFAEGLPC